MVLDLNDVKDGLSGDWWVRIRASDFGYQTRVKNQSDAEVDKDDILIHKEIKEDEGLRFPVVKYHVVVQGDALSEIDKIKARQHLAVKLLQFMKDHDGLPFACTYDKTFKNGSVQLKYNPTKYDSFTLKLAATDLPEGLADKIPTFPVNEVNPLGSNRTGKKNQVFLKKITVLDPAISSAVNVSGGTVHIFDAKVTNVTKRSYTFDEKEIVYYVLDVVDGRCAPDSKKSTMKSRFKSARVKISNNLMISTNVKVKDSVTLRGRLKDDRFLGFIIQNVRKIVKGSVPAKSQIHFKDGVQ
ncbi:MAG: hypothetical protein ACTSUE_00865 [Promethearchaeota archaeon]